MSEERCDMSPADAAVAVADSQAVLHQEVPAHAFACSFCLVFLTLSFALL